MNIFLRTENYSKKLNYLNFQRRRGLNSKYALKGEGLKFIIPYKAFTNLWCTETSSV